MRKWIGIAMAGAVCTLASCQTGSDPAPDARRRTIQSIYPAAQFLTLPSLEGRSGGRLVAAQRAGPKSFNGLMAEDQETLSVSECLMAKLFRINRQSQEAEPELVESSIYSADRRNLRLQLRRGLKFSDGHPFTSEDVMFTFRVLYDPALRCSVTDILTPGGSPIGFEKIDEFTLGLRFVKPHPTPERLLDALFILPRHILEPLHREGSLAGAWNLSVQPNQVVGLGPFVLKEYVPGEKTVLARNPYYWKADRHGVQLPYFDEVIFLIVPDRNMQTLKFESAELDLVGPLSPEDAKRLEAEGSGRQFKVIRLGPSLISELMWFNLNSGTNPKTHRPLVDPVKRAWFEDVRFRQAISLAIDRTAIAAAAFGNSATPIAGPVTPGNKYWFSTSAGRAQYDPERARGLVSEMGLVDRNGDGKLEDAQGRSVSFVLVTNSETEARRRAGLVIQDDLGRLGIGMEMIPIESKALLGRITDSFDYEAVLFSIVLGDTDPSAQANILRSSGSMHWWNPVQSKPSTPWEARIDELMTRQEETLDRSERKRLFDEVQAIMLEQVPFTYLVARDLVVAAQSEVQNLKASVIPDFLMWNVEELCREVR